MSLIDFVWNLNVTEGTRNTILLFSVIALCIFSMFTGKRKSIKDDDN